MPIPRHYAASKSGTREINCRRHLSAFSRASPRSKASPFRSLTIASGAIQVSTVSKLKNSKYQQDPNDSESTQCTFIQILTALGTHRHTATGIALVIIIAFSARRGMDGKGSWSVSPASLNNVWLKDIGGVCSQNRSSMPQHAEIILANKIFTAHVLWGKNLSMWTTRTNAQTPWSPCDVFLWSPYINKISLFQVDHPFGRLGAWTCRDTFSTSSLAARLALSNVISSGNASCSRVAKSSTAKVRRPRRISTSAWAPKITEGESGTEIIRPVNTWCIYTSIFGIFWILVWICVDCSSGIRKHGTTGELRLDIRGLIRTYYGREQLDILGSRVRITSLWDLWIMGMDRLWVQDGPGYGSEPCPLSHT